MAVDRERLAERLAAVERRLTDADPDGGGLADVAAVEGRLSELEGRADEIDDRLGEVESGLQALRGYVGGVDAVDESVERRADAALAKAEELEAMLVDDPGLTVERVPTDSGRTAGEETGTADDRTDGDRHGTEPSEFGPSGGSRAATGPEWTGPGDRGNGAPGGSDAGPDGGERRLVDRLRDVL